MDILYTRWRVVLVAALLALPLPAAASDCWELRELREPLDHQAMQAEIALLHATRLRLCPAQERQAVEANALAAQPGAGTTFDYSAYVHCRVQAEALLQRSRPVLFRNASGFQYYTAEGARLARQADALQVRALAQGLCSLPHSGGSSQPPALGSP